MDFRKRNKSSQRNKSSEQEHNSYLTDNSQAMSKHVINILTNSFKPIIENAHKKYIKDNYTPIVKKVETDRLLLTGKRSEMDMIHEKYFRKSFSKSPSPKRSPRKSLSKKEPIKKRHSFLVENQIIDKKDILNNPCNRNYINICTTVEEDNENKEFYEREQSYKKKNEEKIIKMRAMHENKMINELKSAPEIAKGSQKIIKKNYLHRPPLHERFKEVAQEKTLKIKAIQKELKREYSANSMNKNSAIEEKYNTNISINQFNSNNSAINIRSSSGLSRSRSYHGKDFGNWLENNKKWNKLKESKTETKKIMLENLTKEAEDKLSFNPIINEKSEYIANLKNQNENPNINIHDKLYSLHSKKKEYIQNLEQKYKPTFKPHVNKFPQFLQNNSTNPTNKSYFIEEKEDNYANFALNTNEKNKNDFIKPTSKKDKLVRKESLEFRKFQKDVEDNFYVHKNKRKYTKTKKEIEEFFSKMNKGVSPNYGLEINDIKFYNEIHKN